MCVYCECVQNHKARDKAVRYRVCQLVNRLFQNLGEDAAIDDSLYSEVYSAMQIRLRDKFPIVRVHAVFALARLQDPTDPECPIIAGLLWPILFLYEFQRCSQYALSCMTSGLPAVDLLGV